MVGLPRVELGTFGPQIDAPQTADLRKHPETPSGLLFQLINALRRFALFCDVARPLRCLQMSGERDHLTVETC